MFAAIHDIPLSSTSLNKNFIKSKKNIIKPGMVTVELTQLHDIYNITLTIETFTDQILGLNEKSETGFVLRYLLGYFFSSCLDML